jgi:hypothetical protein
MDELELRETVRKHVNEQLRPLIDETNAYAERIETLERELRTMRELANAKPVSVETLAELGVLASLEAVIDARLAQLFAAALADPNLGDAAIRAYDDDGPAAAVRAATGAFPGYGLNWLARNPREER